MLSIDFCDFDILSEQIKYGTKSEKYSYILPLMLFLYVYLYVSNSSAVYILI